MIRGLILAAALAILSASAPAIAGKADDAWAGCIWRKAPTSASSWLKMPAPKRIYGLSAVPPEYVLQYRLQAACYEEMIPPGKERPSSFNAKAVRAALVRLKPASVAEDEVDPKAYRCTRYFLNDTELKNPAGYDWGFGSDTSKAQFFSIKFFFAAQKGGPVGLTDQGGIRKCAFIRADGTFEDA